MKAPAFEFCGTFPMVLCSSFVQPCLQEYRSPTFRLMPRESKPTVNQLQGLNEPRSAIQGS